MGCVFCDKKGLEERFIAETKNFMVFPTIGQIVEGYTLIVPKDHIKCFGAMPKDLLDEYMELKQRVDAATTAAYEKPIYFEHGIVGQTVYHAHMHCIPTGRDILHRLERFYFRRISSEADLPSITGEFVDGSYFFYDCNGKFAFDVLRGLKSYNGGMFKMALRHAIADEMGIPEAGDWRNVNKEQDGKSIQRTVEKLRPFFK